MKLSVVIPTLGRHASLERLLKSIAAQQRLADEVIIVTGTGDCDDLLALATALTGFARDREIRVIETEASVCIQRNAGIKAAAGTYVCLADDDIELPPDYFSRVLAYLQQTDAGAVTGLVVQPDDAGVWRAQYPPATVWELGWRLLFQQSVWGDVSAVRTTRFGRVMVNAMAAFYRRRGNTYSWAGWPLVTDFSGTAFRTAVYGLGAAVIRRDWLLGAPYDEVLDSHGIGDNYGVAMGFPGCCPIHVLTELTAIHHRESTRRLDARTAHCRRVLALDYFLKGCKRFSVLNRLALRWSLVGFVMSDCLQGDWPAAQHNLQLLTRLCLKPNPYAVGAAAGLKKLQVC